MDIKFQIDIATARKILGNQDRAKFYLSQLRPELKVSSTTAFKTVVETWDYAKSKQIIRDMFRQTEKYAHGLAANSMMAEYISEWRSLGLGTIAWPFSQGDFDGFVQRINSSKTTTGQAKDEETKTAALKYRRIKEINTVRNDFIETLIFEKNDNILPTLNHRRGVDFFIDGVSYDQKVAKSPTAQFKAKFGEQWRRSAIEHPEVVAEYLYRHQDEGRFGADSRLFVVYLDEEVSIDQIRQTINSIDLTKPLEVSFTYAHKREGNRDYKVSCFVILLHS